MTPDKDGKYVIPSVSPKMARNSMDDYAIKYKKVDLDDDGDVLELQMIQTRALRNPEDVTILSEDKMTFMTNYMVIIKYMERVNGNAN